MGKKAKLFSPQNHENEKELFLINKSLSYNKLLNIIKKNINKFDDDTIQKRELYNEQLKLENEQIKLKNEQLVLLKNLDNKQSN